jgi:ribosomal protein L7/L12
MAISRDPGSSFVEAVKAYREESGVGLSEATAVLRHYQSQVKKTSE